MGRRDGSSTRPHDNWPENQVQSMETQSDTHKLSEALLVCRRELAQVRAEQEPLAEQVAHWQARGSNAEAISTYLAECLARELSRAYWEVREPGSPITWRRFLVSRWPWLRFLARHWQSTASRIEAEHTRLIEMSQVFQPAWYLQHYPDVALAGVSPAAHYLRCGAAEGRDPGPNFSTEDYLAQNPECRRSGINPVVHSQQSRTALE